MSTVTLAAGNRPAFVQRFDALRARARLLRLAAVAAAGAAAFLLGLLALAAADYAFELPRQARVAGFALLAAAAVGAFAARATTAWRRTAPLRTAAAVEERFPELGQSVRTLVQYDDFAQAGRLGAAPSLAAALADDTSRRAGPLPLEAVVPTRSLAVAAACAAGLLIAAAALCVVSWEWETALRRSLLAERPWTVLSVSPGATAVREGETLPLAILLEGRTDRPVTVSWRTRGESGWTEQSLTSAGVTETGTRLARYGVRLPRIDDPLEYKVAAGAFAAGPFVVDVRRPLTIESVSVEVVPPAYTGLEPRSETTGDATAVEGSRGNFRVRLDRTPAEAEMVLVPVSGPNGPTPRTVPFRIEGDLLLAELDLTDGFDWSVRAESADGMSVRDNGWRVRVRRDGPPQVWFEKPAELLEVHALAEIQMAVRARDDFGLARSGVVFQVNNEQEYTLLSEEFEPKPGEDGRPAPQTRADLERKLPLEFFELTEKDSVTYYAFAEDNRPGSPHRTETDRRFLDIRPFRRVYRYLDVEDMPPIPGGRELVTLGEIIRRERFVLNRTLRAEKQVAAGEAFDLGVVDRLAAAQGELAAAARRLAEFFVGEGIDGADLMFQAEQSMLAAADSLAAGKFETASLQERDALRSLIEARNSAELFLRKNPEIRAKIAEADRQMAQKIRRDKDDKPRQIAPELRRLARQEGEVAGGLSMTGRAGSRGRGDGGTGDKKPAEAAETTEPKPAGDDAAEPTESTAEPADGSGESKGEAEPEKEEAGSAPLTPQELEERQDDIVRRLGEVESMMRDEEALTDLARGRMREALQTADRAAGELDRGDAGAAAKSAEEASEKLTELARQVEGLLAGEAARKIAEARGLAEELAERERRLAEKLDGPKGGDGESASDSPEPGKGDPGTAGQGEPKRDATKDARMEAERIARSSETLADLLRSVTGSDDPADAETASRLEQALAEDRAGESVEDAKRIAKRIGGGETATARKEAGELAGRFASTARRLDRLYRSIVSPKIDELARLEARAAQLRDRLEEVEDRGQADDWSRDAGELADDLAELRDMESDERLREAIASTRWQPRGTGGLVAPVGYRTAVRSVVEDLQERIQELLLAEVLTDADAAVPAAYRELVDRYYQALSSSASRAAGAPSE